MVSYRLRLWILVKSYYFDVSKDMILLYVCMFDDTIFDHTPNQSKVECMAFFCDFEVRTPVSIRKNGNYSVSVTWPYTNYPVPGIQILSFTIP